MRSVVYLVLTAFLVGATGCGDAGPSGPDPLDAVSQIVVSPSEATVDVGSTIRLSATVLNGRGESVPVTVSWASTSPSVATTDGFGTVSGLAEGTATIIASAGGRSGTSAVAVEDPFPPAQPSDVGSTPLSPTEVRVNWTDSSDNEDEFRIDRERVFSGASGAGNGPQRSNAEVSVVGPNQTEFVDSGLEPGAEYAYRVRACNQNGCSDPVVNAANATTFAELAIEATDLPMAWVGESFSHSFVATGGDGTPTWEISDGSLPSGLTLGSTGNLQGSPAESGTFPFTVQAVDAWSTASEDLTLTVQDVPQIRTTSLPEGTVSREYAAELVASGGDGLYEWTVSRGDLPPGLSLDAGGSIGGIPTDTGDFDFDLGVTSGGRTASQGFSVRINGLLEIATQYLPSGKTGSAYSETLQATGGDGEFTWAVVAGTVPDGLSLNAPSGLLSGIPTSEGDFPFTIQVQSGDGQIATEELSIRVAFVFSCVDQASLPQSECRALDVFYQATQGTQWRDSSGWLSTPDPCDWFGVTCMSGSVTGLALAGNRLTGQIPPDLRLLPNLETLLLQSNRLGGEIPSELGSLSNLEKLDLGDNALEGAIPSVLGHLPSLEELDLGDNALTGEIPQAMGNLSGLTRVFLDGNSLLGEIPLVVAQLGGAIQNTQGLGSCEFTPGNPDLALPDLPDYRLADLDYDGYICRVAFPTDPNQGPPVPTHILPLEGHGSQAPAGTILPEGPTVRVLDQYGYPMSGVTVSFQIVEGGGSVLVVSKVTSTEGMARIPWVLGRVPGSFQRLRVTAGEIQFEFHATAVEAEPGQSYFGRNGYVEYIAGNMPLVVSAPHGGYLRPAEILNRTWGSLYRDRNSRELTLQFVDEVGAETGYRPHVIISHLDRIKLDPNREIVEAAQGDPEGERAWYEFQTFIDQAERLVEEEFGEGLYLDIHTHSHAIQRVELGYLLSAGDLFNSNQVLSTSGFVNKSSLRHLGQKPGVVFSDLIRGPSSLGTLLENDGWPSVPSQSQRNPGAGNPYYEGGYNTIRHGSRDGGTVSGIQIECNFAGLLDTVGNRRAFSQDLVAALETFFSLFLGVPFSGH